MTAPPAGALEACPFCGNADDIEMQQAQADHYVQCLECEASTSCVGSRREAAELWNRRTHGPALLAALRLREACEALVAKHRERAQQNREAHDNSFEDEDRALFTGVADACDDCADDLARVLEESATGGEAGSG